MTIHEGQRIGRLTAIKIVGKDKWYHKIWECKCDCGNIVNVMASSLTNGTTRSCGCLLKETLQSGDIRRTHGDCGTRLYSIWKSMRSRCNNPNNTSYQKWYGAKGIKVCSEWEDYNEFKKWSLDNGYTDDLTIDRIDYDGDYCPENCRWVTQIEQGNNRNSVKHITYNGETHSLREWSNKTGLSRQVLYNRIFVYNWSPEKALTTKKRR